MNTNLEVDPLEVKFIVGELQNLTNADLKARRTAESNLANLSTRGEDFRVLMCVICSEEELSTRQAASLYLKKSLKTNINMTELGLPILQTIEKRILDAVRTGNLTEKITEDLTSVFPYIYGSIKWRKHLDACMEEAFTFLRAPDAKTIFGGIKKCEGMINGLQGGELRDSAKELFKNCVLALQAFWAKLLEVLSDQSEETKIVLHLFNCLLKITYKLISKIFNQDLIALGRQIINSQELNLFVLKPLISKASLFTPTEQDFQTTSPFSSAITEGLLILCKGLEQASKFNCSPQEFSTLIEVSSSSCQIAINYLGYIQQFAPMLILEDNFTASPVVLAKALLKLINFVVKNSKKIESFYTVIFDNLSTLYELAINAFMLYPSDFQAIKESASNYHIDIADFVGGHSIGNVRSLASQIMENTSTYIEPSVSHFCALAVLNIAANLQLESDFGLNEVAKKLGIETFIKIPPNNQEKLSVACANFILLCNMSHATAGRDDLLKAIEGMLAGTLKKVTPETPQVLIVYALQLYKQHPCDIFLHQDSFKSIINFVCRYVCTSDTVEQTLLFLVATDILEALFDIHEEQTSSKFSSLITANAPPLLASLVTGIEKADDQQYFRCIEKYIKVFRSEMNQILPTDLSHIFECLKKKLSKEIDLINLTSDGSELNVYDHSMLFSISELIGEVFVSTKAIISSFSQQIDEILFVLLKFLSNDLIRPDSTFLEIVIDLFRIHISTLKTLSSCHVEFIGQYILSKKLPQTLFDNSLFLLNNYMYYGFASFPEALYDRFIIESQMMIAYNLKRRQGRPLGLTACQALLLCQSMFTHLNEQMTRSQTEDLVLAGLRCLNDTNSHECLTACCFSTLNTGLIYAPRITLDVMSRRDVLVDYVSLLNKKLISICLTCHDRRLLILALISLMKHTLGVESYRWIRHSDLFKFTLLLLNYHMILVVSQEAQNPMTPKDLTHYQKLEADILDLQLVEIETGHEAERNMLEDQQMEEEDDGFRKKIKRMVRKSKAQTVRDVLGMQKGGDSSHDEESDEESSEEQDGYKSKEYSIDDDDFMSSQEEGFGQYDLQQYKMITLKLETPFTVLDEFVIYKEFIIQLMKNNKDIVNALVSSLTPDDHALFYKTLFVKKMSPETLKLRRNRRAEYRGVYRIKRLAEIA